MMFPVHLRTFPRNPRRQKTDTQRQRLKKRQSVPGLPKSASICVNLRKSAVPIGPSNVEQKVTNVTVLNNVRLTFGAQFSILSNRRFAAERF